MVEAAGVERAQTSENAQVIEERDPLDPPNPPHPLYHNAWLHPPLITSWNTALGLVKRKNRRAKLILRHAQGTLLWRSFR